MNVTITLSYDDAVLLDATLNTRKNQSIRMRDNLKAMNEQIPEWLYEDIVEKTRLCEIVADAMTSARNDERMRVDALIKGPR